MAIFVYKDAYVSINTVDLSDHVKSATLEYSSDILDDTAMSADSRSRIAGLKDWSLTIEFEQDFAASEVDATLNGLVGAASTTVAIRPTSDAKGATNPEYTGSAVLDSYTVLQGSVGEVSMATATFLGDGDLTRSTS